MEKINKYKWWQYGSVGLAAVGLVASIIFHRGDLAAIFAIIVILWIAPVFLRR